MRKKTTQAGRIPADVKSQVQAIVDRFNQDNLDPQRSYYEPCFKGKYCYLYRYDF